MRCFFGTNHSTPHRVTTGTAPLIAACTNWTTPQTVIEFLFPTASFDCTARGLATSPGDVVSVLLFSLDSRGDSGPSPGGTVLGIEPFAGYCQNTSTGQKVGFPLSSSSWDCGAQGLASNPFEGVVTLIIGTAK